MRENINPILEEGGVDLVLSGHSHVYERSFFLDGHYGSSDSFDPDDHVVQVGDGREDGDGAYRKPATTPTAHAGAVYVVAGSSGQTEGGDLDHPAMFLSLERAGLAGARRRRRTGCRPASCARPGRSTTRSPSSRASRPPRAPPAPTNLGASGQDARVGLAWTPAPRRRHLQRQARHHQRRPLHHRPDRRGRRPPPPTPPPPTAPPTSTSSRRWRASGQGVAALRTAASATPIAGGQPPAHLQTATGRRQPTPPRVQERDRHGGGQPAVPGGRLDPRRGWPSPA